MNQLMNRRQALGLLGSGVGAVVLGACGGSDGPDGGGAAATTTVATAAAGAIGVEAFAGAASCTLTPEQTEGPYYIDVDSIRADVREDREGVPVRLAVRVLDADGCTPVKDALFEVWHADAGGRYSGFESASTGPGGGRPGSGGGAAVSDDRRYLRGAQVTDADGIAQVTTIYPGWYQGRTVHIHAKVQLSNRELLTTQLYFDDDLTDEVFSRAPYNGQGDRSTRNDGDGIFRPEAVLTVSEQGDGYLAVMTMGVRS